MLYVSLHVSQMLRILICYNTGHSAGYNKKSWCVTDENWWKIKVAAQLSSVPSVMKCWGLLGVRAQKIASPCAEKELMRQCNAALLNAMSISCLSSRQALWVHKHADVGFHKAKSYQVSVIFFKFSFESDHMMVFIQIKPQNAIFFLQTNEKCDVPWIFSTFSSTWNEQHSYHQRILICIYSLHALVEPRWPREESSKWEVNVPYMQLMLL